MQFEYQTERLILRILKPDYAKEVLDFFLADQEYYEKYEPDRPPHFYSVSHQKSLLRYEYNAAMSNTLYRYYISTKENPDLIIGTICFHNVTPSIYAACEVGYKFSQKVQHLGYASESLACLTQAIFKELGLHRITAMVQPENLPSIQFVERNGFVREGLCHEFAFIQGDWQDYYMYNLISPYK